jgi:hypothetical protein
MDTTEMVAMALRALLALMVTPLVLARQLVAGVMQENTRRDRTGIIARIARGGSTQVLATQRQYVTLAQAPASTKMRQGKAAANVVMEVNMQVSTKKQTLQQTETINANIVVQASSGPTMELILRATLVL